MIRTAFAMFAVWAGAAGADVCAQGELADLLDEKRPESCGLSQMTNGDLEEHCAWRFEGGSATAQARFDALAAALDRCGTQLPADTRVNHPDSYDLRSYETGVGRISLSLKEKHALGARYIFVRRGR